MGDAASFGHTENYNGPRVVVSQSDIGNHKIDPERILEREPSSEDVPVLDPVDDLLALYKCQMSSPPQPPQPPQLPAQGSHRNVGYKRTHADENTGIDKTHTEAVTSSEQLKNKRTQKDEHCTSVAPKSPHAKSPMKKKPALRDSPINIPFPDLEDLAKIRPQTEPSASSETQSAQKFRPIAFRNRRTRRLVVAGIIDRDGVKELKCLGESELTTVTLQDSWRTEDVRKGDTIHVFGDDIPSMGPLIVNHANERLLIVQPDILVSCTAVAESLNCERQVVLKQRVRVPGAAAKVMVFGSVTHSLIQSALMDRDFSNLESKLHNLVILFAEDLTLVGCTVEEAERELKEKLPTIRKWAAERLGKQATVDNHRGRGTTLVHIDRARRIEEEIRSPFLGIKGKVDVTVEATSIEQEGQKQALTGLEIKTGRSISSIAHRAQTILYTLLLRERHPGNCHPWSLLYYCDQNHMILVRVVAAELRELIKRRNTMARMLAAPVHELPALLTGQSHLCERCGVQDACVVYHKLSGEEVDPSASITDAVDTLELSNSVLNWYKHWDRLLTMESTGRMNTLLQDPWWVSNPQSIFWRISKRLSTVPSIYELVTDDLTNVKIAQGDSIVLSTAQHMAVAHGWCLESTTSRLVVRVDATLLQKGKYRVDREEFSGSTATARYNLLATICSPEASRLKELVVDLEQPTYERAPTQVPNDFSFNSDQQLAINRVLGARDFALVLGMPGSGKTTLVAAIIAALVARGFSVLVTGYTHMAVDNILLKLAARQVKYLRIGRSQSILEEVSAQSQPFSSGKDVPVVAATALGMSDPLFSVRRFDYCIVDEASQITLPVCLGPLLCASKFVLVGDHYQLPPLVHNAQAKSQGLGESLFKRLCDAHPGTVSELTHQYRMCADIMLLSSQLIYDGRLKCGNDLVANKKLDLRTLNLEALDLWLRPVLNPENRVVFLDTDSCPSTQEQHHAGGSSNAGEAALVTQICNALVAAGLSSEELGVISVYRLQLQLLKSNLASEPHIEVMTADQSQGRDKDCIIVSLVRSNSEGITGELLRDWRRLNVAFTRARSKLVIVGSRSTLGSSATPDLARFIHLIQTQHWVWPAPQRYE